MDWRHRDYYIVATCGSEYEMRHELYKQAAPSLKSTKAYGHFGKGYDGFYCHMHQSPQEMISCRKEESDALEAELNKAKRHSRFSRYIKLSKEMLGQ